jgi:hypothetical protein
MKTTASINTTIGIIFRTRLVAKKKPAKKDQCDMSTGSGTCSVKEKAESKKINREPKL